MNKNDILLLFDYNYWATAQVLRAAEKASPAQYTAPAPASHGSLRGALVHILGAEVVWRTRAQEGVSLAAMPTEDELPTLEMLTTRWSTEELAMHAYLSGLEDADLHRTFRYRRLNGEMQENILWYSLMHVVNHGTQFRSEAAMLLTGYGFSPGDLDLIYYIRLENGVLKHRIQAVSK